MKNALIKYARLLKERSEQSQCTAMQSIKAINYKISTKSYLCLNISEHV